MRRYRGYYAHTGIAVFASASVLIDDDDIGRKQEVWDPRAV